MAGTPASKTGKDDETMTETERHRRLRRRRPSSRRRTALRAVAASSGPSPKEASSVKAVRGVDLVINSGEMVSLEGPSGSGKTTLLQLLGALDSPTGGTIRFADRDLGGLSDKELTKIRAEEIGFVFQHFNLIPTLTAEENVAIAMFPNHVRAHERLERAKELLNQVGLGHRLGHLPSRLSGGEQQRVAIARALANSPSVIIADEPTGNLDSDTAKEVMATLNDAARERRRDDRDRHPRRGRRPADDRRIRIRDGAIREDTAA